MRIFDSLLSGARLLMACALGIGAALAPPAAHAGTEIQLNVLDAAGEGFRDLTPFVPVGGNPATTLGAARLIAFRHAAFILGSKLRHGVGGATTVIKVDVNMDPLFCNATGAILGSAGALTVHRDFVNAPVANTWYPQALANSLAGTDLDPADADASAVFNSDFGTNPACGASGWYYGLDGNPPLGQVDYVSVVLHELSHATGFQSFIDVDTGAKLLGRDDIFLNHLARIVGGVPTPLATMASDTDRQNALASDPNLVWNGPSTNATAGGLTAGTNLGFVRMHGPNPIVRGSTGSHFSQAVTANESMEPSYNGGDHTPGRTVNVFEDIGWAIEPGFGADVVFILDLTGSTGALIGDWIAQIPAIVTSWQNALAPEEVRFAVASHFDYPYSPYAEADKWAYRIESTLSADPLVLQAALTTIAGRLVPDTGTGGGDTAESQYEAIYQALTGDGREFAVPLGDFNTAIGEIPNLKLTPDSDRPTVFYHFTFPEVFHNRDLEPNYPFAGATDPRPGAHPIPGETQVQTELATRSANNTFFGLTFIGAPPADRVGGTARSGPLPITLYRAGTASTGPATGPLARLASVSNGAVFNVSSATGPFDVKLLKQAVNQSIGVFNASPGGGDADGDGVPDATDNCPNTPNRDQSDVDGDGIGDVCDNCSVVFNPNQLDLDHNGFGDVCNCQGGSDTDGDGICDGKDRCPGVVQTDITQADTDENGIPDECECGDVDHNGRVNSTDARLIQRCVVGDIECDALCDVNGDGKCNTADARLIQQLAVGQVKVTQLSCAAKNGGSGILRGSGITTKPAKSILR